MIRPVRLAQVAAEAEVLRLKQMATRTSLRVAYGVIAMIFLVAVLVDIHVMTAIWLLPHFGPLLATVIVLAGDVVLLVIFGLLAGISRPGKIEREARQVREAARSQLVQMATTASLVTMLTRALTNRSAFRAALAGVIARMFTSGMRR